MERRHRARREDGFCPIFPCLCLVSFTTRTSTFSAQSWPAGDRWMCLLNLGGVFIIFPKGRGIFICKAQRSTEDQREKDQWTLQKVCGEHHWQLVTGENSQHLCLSCFACLKLHVTKPTTWKFQLPTAVNPFILFPILFQSYFLCWRDLAHLLLFFAFQHYQHSLLLLWHEDKANPYLS